MTTAPPNPKVIGIQFADNDFYFTFRGFLTTLMQRGLDSFPNLTKERLADLFNTVSYSMYLLHQQRDFGFKPSDKERYEKILHIDADDIYFDDEVAAYIKSEADGRGFNCEFHVLDTQVFEPYVYTC